MLSSKLIGFKSKHIASCTAMRIVSSCHSSADLKSRNYASSSEPEKTRQEKIAEKLEELKTNWTPIYRFPKISSISILNKIKNYQLAASAIAIPVSYFALPEDFIIIFCSAAALSASLSFGSFIVKDAIGFIYVHKNESDLVRIAYLNFWGFRRDSIFKISDIVPFSELPPPSALDKIYTTVKFKNDHHDLKLFSKTVEVLDEEKFDEIFGIEE